mmetsp:Transcript_84514/g.176834  ORF Transcript_84514/g.176834 Transcript_84514/m.176834 type:complete len:298 (+) Transcript_84514:168-1061(+)
MGSGAQNLLWNRHSALSLRTGVGAARHSQFLSLASLEIRHRLRIPRTPSRVEPAGKATQSQTSEGQHCEALAAAFSFHSHISRGDDGLTLELLLGFIQGVQKLDAFDVAQVRIHSGEVGIALGLHLLLVGSAAGWGALAIAGIELIHDIHAFDYFTNGRETLIVQESVVLEVNEELGRSSIGTCHGICQTATGVRDLVGVVRDGGLPPLCGDGGRSRDAKLSHEVMDNPEESNILEEVCFHELLESGCTQRSPIRMHFDCEGTCGTMLEISHIEPDLVGISASQCVDSHYCKQDGCY